MSIFTKRNAAVGYITLKAASHALERRRGRRSRPKLGLYVALGLISFGILAGVAAVAMRRRRGTAEGPEEGSSATAEAEGGEADDEGEIVGEYVTAAPEPIPAT